MNILFLLAFFSCHIDAKLRRSFSEVHDSNVLNFIMIGDWGGVGVRPYTTPMQKANAKGMADWADKNNAKFILGLGDNFYFDGIPSDEDDERFQKTWHDVYIKDKPSLNVPWYLCAGNHDHKGNVSAQIEYTSHDEFWNFPDYNYKVSHSWTEGDKTYTLDIILFDSVEIVGMADEQDDVTNPAYFLPPTGPKDVTLAQSTWDWIRTQLSESTADFILVGGHYPVWSVCDHGPNQDLVDQLAPMLEEFDAHYLSGHDHCQMHIKDKGVNYILSGMGDDCCYDASNLDAVPEDSLQFYVARKHNPTHATAGFSSYSLSSQGLNAKIHDQNGEVLYEVPNIALRQK